MHTKWARNRFKRGDYVVMTAMGQKAFNCKEKAGQVVGFSRDGHNVRIRQFGLKTAVNYYPDFWEVDNTWDLQTMVGAELALEMEERDAMITTYSSPLPGQIVTGLPSLPVEKADNIKTESKAVYAAGIAQAERLEKLATPEVSLLTSEPHSDVWQRLKSFATGIKRKLLGESVPSQTFGPR